LPKSGLSPAALPVRYVLKKMRMTETIVMEKTPIHHTLICKVSDLVSPPAREYVGDPKSGGDPPSRSIAFIFCCKFKSFNLKGSVIQYIGG
jgi:hypothetical protein